jgi:deoxycytidine triphosphate deaminase
MQTTILSATEIRQAISDGEIVIDPFNELNLKPASYVFTLGDRYRRHSRETIDTRVKPSQFREFKLGQGGTTFGRGDFIIGHTQEILRLNKNMACFLSMRGACAQMGIDALRGEIFCEPGSEGGWEGKLMLEMMFSSLIGLHPQIPIVKGIFFRVAD